MTRPPTPEEVAGIARKLTPAQKKATLCLPADGSPIWRWSRKAEDIRGPTIRTLCEFDLVIIRPGRLGRTELRLTPLGQQVAAGLRAMEGQRDAG